MSSKYNDSTCKLYHKTDQGNSSLFHLQNPYGGIPQNLLTNAIGLAILLALFLFLRKSAWKVLNHIVPKNDMDRWTHIFFSFSNALTHVSQRRSHQEADFEVIDPTEGGFEGIQEEQVVASEEESADDGSSRVSFPQCVVTQEPGPHPRAPEVTAHGEPVSMSSNHSLSYIREGSFMDWLKSIFTLGDEEISESYGEDALQYLRFQRYVIGYLVFVMVICISVILPLNFIGEKQGDESSFGHTTLSNLDPNSDVLWAHVTLSFLLFPVVILVMRRFSVEVEFQDVGLEMRRTLMIEKVPRAMCHEPELRRHFLEAYQQVEIKKIDFAFDVYKLQQIFNEWKEAKLGLKYCNRHDNLNKDKFHLYRANCSRFCGFFCCCCSDKVEATEYYQERVDTLTQEFLEEKDKSMKHPVGIVFITFKSINSAKEVYDSFRRSALQCNFQPPASTLSSVLRPQNWIVSFAPMPEDIYWENLNVARKFLKLKYVAINIALFFVAFFLTTPEYIVSQTDWLVKLFGETLKLPAPIVDFLPTILLWSFTALLPLLVAYSDRFLGHYTRSDENHSIMKKTFWYLLFMVIFFPTFGFTTAQVFIEAIFNTNSTGGESIRWDCVFLPDSGAFFVNYVITAGLVGCGLELIRFPDMFWYLIQLCWSRSPADGPAIQRAVRFEFRFGEQYARQMLLFCMTMMFCVSCPLITPFGLIYFIVKHYVDRHNIFFVYKPSKINKKVHASAISFIVLSTVVLQFFMTIFSVLRSGAALNELTLRSKYAIGLFLVSVNIFSAQLWSETCRKFSPIEYMECTLVREQDLNQPDLDYVPDILKEGVVRYRHFPADEDGTAKRQESNEETIAAAYGTFDENT